MLNKQVEQQLKTFIYLFYLSRIKLKMKRNFQFSFLEFVCNFGIIQGSIEELNLHFICNFMKPTQIQDCLKTLDVGNNPPIYKMMLKLSISMSSESNHINVVLHVLNLFILILLIFNCLSYFFKKSSQKELWKKALEYSNFEIKLLISMSQVNICC